MKNVIKTISVILVPLCVCVGCNGSKLSGAGLYGKVTSPATDIEL